MEDVELLAEEITRGVVVDHPLKTKLPAGHVATTNIPVNLINARVSVQAQVNERFSGKVAR